MLYGRKGGWGWEGVGKLQTCPQLFENYWPPFGQKSKNVPNCGVVAICMQDYCNSYYTEEVWSCRLWSFLPFLKILKIYPFMIKKPKPRFFSFGVSAITLLLINLLINVTFFWNRLLNVHLLTYQTVPSSIFDFCLYGPQKSQKVENHYIFYIYIIISKICKKKSGGNNFTVTSVR